MTAKKLSIPILILIFVLAAALFCLIGCQRIAVYNVVLNETYIEMNVGDTSTLVATADTEVPVTVAWTSSHTDVATVEDGVVTAVGAGAASIKATAQDKVAVCTVVVRDTSTQVSAIMLDVKEAYMAVGDDISITATTIPNPVQPQNIVWQSTDSYVASVYGGHVTALHPGTTFISARVGAAFAMCRVEVLNDYGDNFADGPLNFATLKNDNTIVTGKVKENSVCTFNFDTEVTCAPNASYTVYKDIECSTVVASKIVSLQNGFNNFYIIATQNGQNTFYQVIIEQQPTFTVALSVDSLLDDISIFCNNVNTNVEVFAEGEIVTVDVSTIPFGFIFNGWYDGEVLKSSMKRYSFYMPSHDLSYTAKIGVEDRIANLDFNLTEEGFVILGFKEGADTSRLVIPEYTVRIKDNAFSSANKINKVTWLATDCQGTEMNSTGSNLIFRGCSIQDFHLDKSVMKLNKNLFWGTEIHNVYYNGSIADWCLINFAPNGNPLTYNSNFYVNNELIEDLVIPERITEIKQYAFESSRIKSVTFPRSLQTIGPAAFFNCEQLTTINWAEGLKTIDNEAFCYCRELTGQIVLPSTLTTLGGRAFGLTKVNSVVIPNSVEGIGNDLFDQCTFLRSVLYEGTYGQWTKLKENMGVRNNVLFAAKLYTLKFIKDNPNGYYWEWDISTNERVPIILPEQSSDKL